MKTLLVTGGAGFIGSCFVRMMLKDARCRIINLDLLTYAGSLDNLPNAEGSRYRFIQGDICDRALLARLFDEEPIDTVINFAAESHVDRSIQTPELFFKTNVLGTQALLDAAKNSWALNARDYYCREYRPGVKFIQISTDEVYGALGPSGYFTESTPLSPSSPYSASKASADMLVRAYHHTFGLPINITRCSNNYGPYQFPEKLIPLMIHNAINDTALPVYGDGLQIRDWLYVEDHCSAIAAVMELGKAGEVYNIGGNCERTNLEIVKTVLKMLNKPESLIRHITDRPGHDRRYAIDSAKAKRELNWRPSYTFEEGIKSCVEWYMSNGEWLNRRSREISDPSKANIYNP